MQVKHSISKSFTPPIPLILLTSTKKYTIFSSSAQALMSKSLNKTEHSPCLFEIILPQAVLKAFVHLLKLFCTRVAIFFWYIAWTRETKEKINKRDCIKLQSFCIAKEIINQMKRQPTEWEKMFTNDTSEKGLISKTYKEVIQLNTKKSRQSN